MTREEMTAAVSGSETKSAKIRILSELGVPLGEIARFLDVRYQHVYNVLHRDRNKGTTKTGLSTPAMFMGRYTVYDGKLTLPREVVERLDDGGDIFVFEDEEGLRLVGRQTALERLKPLLRSRLPSGVAAMIEALVETKD